MKDKDKKYPRAKVMKRAGKWVVFLITRQQSAHQWGRYPSAVQAWDAALSAVGEAKAFFDARG